jgi:hypothetical protein
VTRGFIGCAFFVRLHTLGSVDKNGMNALAAGIKEILNRMKHDP